MESSGATRGSMLPFFSSRKKRFITGSSPAVVPARMLVLEVGATGVGLIEETYVPDVPAARGGEKGYFAFGGSTVMCFFEPGRIRLAPDLLEKTAEGMELFARQGDMMGVSAE